MKNDIETTLTFLGERILHHTGKEMKVIMIQGGNFDQYLAACKIAKDPEFVITVTMPDKDLYRVPSFDVEFNIDMKTGKRGVTGKIENVKRFLN